MESAVTPLSGAADPSVPASTAGSPSPCASGAGGASGCAAVAGLAAALGVGFAADLDFDFAFGRVGGFGLGFFVGDGDFFGFTGMDSGYGLWRCGAPGRRHL